MIPSQFHIPRSAVGDVVVVFPGALGDFLCLLEGLGALRKAVEGTILVVSNPTWASLLDPADFRTLSIDSRAVSQLFGGHALDEARSAFGGASWIYSWTGSTVPGFEERLRQVSAGGVAVFPFRDFRPHEHAAEYYARCLSLRPQPARVHVAPDAAVWAETSLCPLRHPILAVHTGSGSPGKNWRGFGDLAQRWRDAGSVVEIRGPAETLPPIEADLRIEAPLARVAAVLRAADLYLGNDSGITHLAATLGREGVAVFGDTNLTHWRPRSGSIRVASAGGLCRACHGPGICVHVAEVDAVLRQLRRLQT